MCLLVVCFYMKALDNNDLNKVRLTSGFVKSRVCWRFVVGAKSRRLIKPGLGRSYLRIFVSRRQRIKLLNASVIRLCPLASHRCRTSSGSTGISLWTWANARPFSLCLNTECDWAESLALAVTPDIKFYATHSRSSTCASAKAALARTASRT